MIAINCGTDIVKQMLKYGASLDGLFFALADPTRRAIVERLARGDAAVSELARPFNMSLSAVHQHLAVLREAGLVASVKKGRTRTCRLESDRLAMVEDWVRERRRGWQRRLDKLEGYLKKQGSPRNE